MPGIFELYHSTAMSHINGWANKPHKISRSKVEFTLLRELDKAYFPIEWKMAWYNAVLTSNTFDVIWIGAQQKYSLPNAAVARYVPDEALCTYLIDDNNVYIHDSTSISSNYLGPMPRRRTNTSLHSTKPSHDNSGDERVDEVWYGEKEQVKKVKSAGLKRKRTMPTVEGKQIGGGDGKAIKKAKVTKRATRQATKAKALARAKKATIAKVAKN